MPLIDIYTDWLKRNGIYDIRIQIIYQTRLIKSEKDDVF